MNVLIVISMCIVATMAVNENCTTGKDCQPSECCASPTKDKGICRPISIAGEGKPCNEHVTKENVREGISNSCLVCEENLFCGYVYDGYKCVYPIHDDHRSP